MKHFGKKILALVLALMCIATVGAVSVFASGYDYPSSQAAGFSKPRAVGGFSKYQRNYKTGEEFATYRKSPIPGYETVYDYATPKHKGTYQVYGIKKGSSTPEYLGSHTTGNHGLKSGNHGSPKTGQHDLKR